MQEKEQDAEEEEEEEEEEHKDLQETKGAAPYTFACDYLAGNRAKRPWMAAHSCAAACLSLTVL